MFLEEPTFTERLVAERDFSAPRQYALGSIVATGSDNRCGGNALERDKVLGREVRMTLTNTHPRIRRIAHPAALAALEMDAGKGDPRWQVKSMVEYEHRCALCGFLHPNAALRHSYRSCPRCSGILTLPTLLHDEVATVRDREEKERARRAASNDQTIAMGAEAWKPEPLYILAAALGHPKQPAWAVDVAEALRGMIEKPQADIAHLKIPAGTILHKLLSVQDPCPGHAKVLKVRYELIPAFSTDWRKSGTKGELRQSVEPDGTIQGAFSIGTPTRPPLVQIKCARWGHPLGGRRGRGAFDVTEAMQGKLDVNDSSFVEISHNENLYSIFDDPAKGMAKDLVIDYELMGTGDRVQVDEMNDYVVQPLVAKMNPRFAPLLIIHTAEFGLSLEGAEARRKALTKQLYDVSVVANRKKQRLFCDTAQLKALERGPRLKEEMVALSPETCEYGVVDVRRRIQEIVDAVADEHTVLSGAGNGRRLLIHEGQDLRDLLSLGGVLTTSTTSRGEAVRNSGVGDDTVSPVEHRDPDEGSPWSTCPYKQLTLSYTIVGHDSERKTSSQEVTESGGDRNFICYRSGTARSFCVDKWEKVEEAPGTCKEDTSNESEDEFFDRRRVIVPVRYVRTSRLTETLDIEAKTVFPAMKIENARYGHHTNPRKQIDVKSSLEDIVETQGRSQFVIDKSMNLQQLFSVNPLRGYRKLLSVGYVARGLMGTLRVPADTESGTLIADLFIGFPPAPPPPPTELESDRLARELRDYQDGMEKAKAARRRELRRKNRLRLQGMGKPRECRTNGGLLGRRVVIVGMSAEHEHLNGMKGRAIAVTVGRGSPSCRYSVKLDSQATTPVEVSDLVTKKASQQHLQVLALKLQDLEEPEDELPEEGNSARQRRLKKEAKRAKRRAVRKKKKEEEEIIHLVRGVRGLSAPP